MNPGQEAMDTERPNSVTLLQKVRQGETRACVTTVFARQTLKGDKPKIQLCGFQSNLFMKIYPVRQTVLLCVFVLINRHQEDVTRSSFNKSEFSFTTWYCTRSSAETDFFLTDLSLKKSHRYCEFCINWWTVS